MAGLRAWGRAAPLASLLLLSGAWAASASAQEGDERLVLREVDATGADDVTLTVTWSGDESDLDDLAVDDGGTSPEVDVRSLADAGIGRDVVFVVDTSTSTDANALVAQTKDALAEVFAEVPDGARYGLFSVGSATQLLVEPTTDTAALTAAVDRLSPEGDGGLLGGITRASAISPRADALRDIVLITDGVSESTVPSSRVRSALLDTGAVLHVVGLQAGGLDEASLSALARAAGGSFQVDDDAGDIARMLGELEAELQQGAVATFAAPDGDGIRDLVVSIGSTQTEGSYVVGADLVGPLRLEPRPPVDAGGVDWLQGDTAKYLGFAGVAIALVMFAYAILALFVRSDDGLSAVLRPYADGYLSPDEAADEGDGNQNLAQTAILQRAVALTESFAERQGFLTRVERALEKAGLPLRAGEALFFYVAAVAVAILLAVALTRNITATLLIAVFAAIIPPAVVNFMASRKKKQFEALLPDTLQLLSSTLRAGYSMMQGVEAVSQEAAEPMGAELRRVVTEARLGRPLEESLEAIALRMDSKDFDWAVMAIRIQREVGGNLSELLLTVAETMTQRERLRRDIQSLTAEGRISAYVLVGLPVGLGLFLYTANPNYIGRLFETGVGQIMLGASALMIVAGMLWMNKIIKIEV